MITQKLKKLFLFSLVPIYLHGVEEIITDFPRTDSFMVAGSNYFGTGPEQFYWFAHILWWISLPILYLAFNKSRIALFLFSLFSVFFIIELHHVFKAVYSRGYYPGLLTALIYSIISVFYFKELIVSWRNYGNATH